MLSPEFKEATWKLINYSLGSIRALEESGTLPTIKNRRLSFRTENSYSWNEEEITNFPLISMQLSIAIEKTPEFAEFLSVLKADPLAGNHIDKIVGTTEVQTFFQATDLFRLIITLILKNNPKISNFNRKIFDKAFGQIETILSNQCFRQSYVAILENLDSEIKNEEIGKGIFIKGLTLEEVEELWNEYSLIQSHYHYSNFPYVPPTRIKSVLYITVDEPKIIASQGSQPKVDSGKATINWIKPLFERAVTALKLLKMGSVKLGPIIHNQSPLFPGERLTHSGPASPTKPLFEYRLLPSDLIDLQTLFLALEKIDPSNKTYRIGLDRYNMAVERDLLEDALLDSMICCEAFLLNDIKERGELGFRLALRAAHLLGESSEEKQTIFLSSKNAYNVRSKIIHGNSLSPKQVESLPSVVDLGRKVAKEMVLLNARREKPHWDEMLFK